MFLLFLLLGCTPEGPDYSGPGVLQFDGEAPKNLLFLSIDTLRRDRVDVHGAVGVTPFLAELAGESLVLDDFQQCGAWTAPSVACTLAGRSAIELGYGPRLGPGDSGVPLPKSEPLLADFLAAEGFWTGLVSGNAWLSPDVGTGAGYEVFQHEPGGAAAVREAGLKKLAAVDDQPWFLHLHHMEPHFPYTPPDDALVGYDALKPWPEDLRDRETQAYWRDAWETLTADEQALLESHLELLYEGEIRDLDRELAKTWEALEAGGWLEDTLVVLWSDHGEQIFEHGWKGHAHSLHSDENDAVALFWAEEITPLRHSGPTHATDLVPTALTALGIEVPGKVTGEVVGTADPGRARFSAVMGYGGFAQAVTVDGVKLHYRWDGSMSVFERDVDRAEKDDRFSISDPRVEGLWSALEPQVQALSKLVGEEPNLPGGVD